MDKSRTPDPRYRRKLNEQEVAHIKWMINEGIDLMEIANMYNVTRSLIWQIREQRIWRGVSMRRSFVDKYLTDRGRKILGHVGLAIVVIMAAWGMYAGLTY